MSKVFDYESSLRRMGDDVELFQEMLGLLRADAPPLVDTVRRAHRARDHKAVERAAHTLKGLSANFSAVRAVAAAAEVERLARHRQESGMDVAVQELASAVDELVAALADHVPGGPVPLGT
jgi:two-component system, sensor histidine kinase and response regulator